MGGEEKNALRRSSIFFFGLVSYWAVDGIFRSGKAVSRGLPFLAHLTVVHILLLSRMLLREIFDKLFDLLF